MKVPTAPHTTVVTAISLTEEGWCFATQQSPNTQRSAKCISSSAFRRRREQVHRRCLEVIVGREVLKEVTLLLHDPVELVDVDLAIAITVGLVDHVLELLVVDVLTELLCNTGEVAEGDLVGVVVVEKLEDLLDVLASVLLAHLAGHHLQEFAELDGVVAVVVDVGDHLFELLVLDLEAKGTHGGLELTDVDLAGGIRVEEGERLADLVELLVGVLTWLLLGGTAGHVESH